MKLATFRPLTILLLTVTALALVVGDADARFGGGRSFGSRGFRTYSAPPITRTAPNTAAPIQRSITQPNKAGSSVFGRTAPATGSFFGRPGFLGGLFAGFLGAGLFGMLFGHGLFGGLGGGASLLGLLLQIVLVIVVARLAMNWWRRRNAPAYAGASEPSSHSFGGSGFGGAGLGGGFGSAPAEAEPVSEAIEIAHSDFDAFERLLTEIQLACSREDIEALRQRATPEIVSYFAEDLTDNASRGVTNRLSDVKLLQGDLAEAWRDDKVEYATVAMTFSLIDVTVDRASGRVVEGDETHPVQATELWTFRRAVGGQWLLSAIQQA